MLGKEKLKEVDSYDHVGIKVDIDFKAGKRTRERIGKGRRAFYALTGIGISKGALTR